MISNGKQRSLSFTQIRPIEEYGIVREDEVNDFKVKYRNHRKNQLKQTLKKPKSDKTVELRSRIQNNQLKTSESSSLDGIDHDFKIKNHFWKYVKLIFEKPAMVFPSFDKDACYQLFKNCFSRSKINRLNIPAWMPQYDNPKKSFNLRPPSYRDISKIISKMKAGVAACPLNQISVFTLKKCPYLRTYLTCLIQRLWKGQNISFCLENGSYHINILMYKSDDPLNRSITLENVFLKVYTLFIRNRIFEYLKANDCIKCRVQKGFIPKISATIEHTLHTLYGTPKENRKHK